MKKILVICSCLVLLFSVSFVSAGFFGDFWSKITGNTIGASCSQDSPCGQGEYCNQNNECDACDPGDPCPPTVVGSPCGLTDPNACNFPGGYCDPETKRCAQEICADADGDGSFAGPDCDPNVLLDCDDDTSDDPVGCANIAGIDCNEISFSVCAICINPDATEVCDDIDNNCVGGIDEDNVCAAPTCIDGDGDGYNFTIGGECGTIVDCDDNDNTIYPGAPELCDNLDNNCNDPGDGSGIDEGLPDSSISINFGVKELNDACTSNSDVIRKYWCDQGQLKNDIYSCSNEVGADSFCDGGTCVSCVDTDLPALNGKNYTVSGSAFNLSNINNPAPDSCIDSTTLNESFCSTNNIIDFQVIDCSSEFGASYSCKDGACFCETDYVADMITCTSDDIVTFKDLSACDAPDYTGYYDCDGNGVVSEPSCTGIDNVSIGGVLFDTLTNYTDMGIETVQVGENFQGVEFNWDFSELLNFCEIEVETSDPTTDNFGYVLFNTGADISNKTVWFDRLNNSNQVCIKDIPGVVSVNEFSGNCNATGEILASCGFGSPISTNASGYIYKCQITGNQFKVWPLQHSAIMEWFTGAVVGCNPNWNCTLWSPDLCVEGENQTKTCVDENACDPNNLIRNETQTCIVPGTSCTPSWNYPSWNDIKCVNGQKTRTVTDSEGCNLNTGKPNETIQCREKAPTLWIILIILAVLLIILGIVYFIRKNRESVEAPVSPTPPSPPAAPRAVQPIPKLPAQPVQ